VKSATKNILLGLFLFLQVSPAFAADSYRWLHVTIDTPWAIFVFLLPMVLFPAVLMAILYWRVAVKRAAQLKEKGKLDTVNSPDPF